MSDSSAKPKLVTTPSSEVVEKPKRRRLTTAYNAWCEIGEGGKSEGLLPTLR